MAIKASNDVVFVPDHLYGGRAHPMILNFSSNDVPIAAETHDQAGSR